MTEEEVKKAYQIIATYRSMHRKIYERQCPVCETMFQGAALRKYCSNACRQKAYLSRKNKSVAGQIKKSISILCNFYNNSDDYDNKSWLRMILERDKRIEKKEGPEGVLARY